jgi:hypothetical protein
MEDKLISSHQVALRSFARHLTKYGKSAVFGMGAAILATVGWPLPVSWV